MERDIAASFSGTSDACLWNSSTQSTFSVPSSAPPITSKASPLLGVPVASLGGTDNLTSQPRPTRVPRPAGLNR